VVVPAAWGGGFVPGSVSLGDSFFPTAVNGEQLDDLFETWLFEPGKPPHP
jgi:hypothetical protein